MRRSVFYSRSRPDPQPQPVAEADAQPAPPAGDDAPPARRGRRLLAALRHPGALWAAARVHPDAKNTAQAAAFAPEAERLAEWLLSDPRFSPQASRMEKQIRAGAQRFSAFYLMEADQPKAALAHYARSFRLSPAAALQDWRRILAAAAGALGLGALTRKARQVRRERYNSDTASERTDK